LLRVLERAGPGGSPVSPLAVYGLRPCLGVAALSRVLHLAHA